MNNRTAFIDFVRGLLTINPLERWSPQQAKLHPFITQQKYTGPFVPPMNLKSSSLNRSPAPGTQQQQQAEALSKQRAQVAQANANSAAAQTSFGMPANQYQQQPPQHAAHTQQPPIYQGGGSMYSPSGGHQAQPPPYMTQQHQQQGVYGQVVVTQPPPQIQQSYASQQQQQQPNLYQQATMRAGRQRASTVEQQGIPAAIQRVASHLDPNHPIRLQPSPAYYPPPSDGGASMADAATTRRRGSRAQQTGQRNHNLIRNLEERTLEEGFMGGQNQWH